MIPEILAYDHSYSPATERPIEARAVLNGLPPNDDYGSWQVHLGRDGGHTALGTCGRCTRCLDSCPTGAFIGPYHLDPQRCISYWTIETRKPVPRELRPLFGNRLFGCDICQEVCPWNRNLDEHQPLLTGLQANRGRIAPPLLEGFAQTNPYWLNREAFDAQFRHSPVRRAKREGMLRNVCIALGNWAVPAVVTPLQIAVSDREPVVRGHAAWALGRVLARQCHPDVRQLLENALGRERDNWVREEINMALDG